ncbi:MAG: hypothetical protein ACLQUY_04705 [Ktedonobacterales bacterium]
MRRQNQRHARDVESQARSVAATPAIPAIPAIPATSDSGDGGAMPQAVAREV